MDDVTFRIDSVRAHLDTAKAVIGARVEGLPTGKPWPADLALVVMSITYVHSFMALDAFVNGQLFCLWRDDHREFRKRHRVVDDFSTLLLHRKYFDLKSRARLLCDELDIAPLHQAVPAAWNSFCQIVRNARHFMVHPNPQAGLANQAIMPAAEQPHGLPIDTVQSIISYVYSASGRTPPSWLDRTTRFSFPVIRVATA